MSFSSPLVELVFQWSCQKCGTLFDDLRNVCHHVHTVHGRSSVVRIPLVRVFRNYPKIPRTLYNRITPKTGAGLHKVLLQSVMRAPQSFFDETDSGVTLNRFSQDMTLIDGQLPASAVVCLTGKSEIYYKRVSHFLTNFSSCVPILRAVGSYRCWIKLHGFDRPGLPNRSLLPAKFLPSNISTNAIPRSGMQKSVIYPYR